MAVARGRNWATILYPESMPADWEELIDELHVSAFLSPLHDSDCDKYGVLVKPHYHFMVMYENPHTQRQFQACVVELLNGAGSWRLESRRGYARYLCHLDHPTKFQYPVEQVRSYCGMDYVSIINSSSDNLQALNDILDFVSLRKDLTYSQLVDYSRVNNKQWFAILMGHQSQYIMNYFRTRMDK